eukprot:963361-Amphidinium_carterae.1
MSALDQQLEQEALLALLGGQLEGPSFCDQDLEASASEALATGLEEQVLEVADHVEMCVDLDEANSVLPGKSMTDAILGEALFRDLSGSQ